MAITEGVDSFCTLEYAEDYFLNKVFNEEWENSSTEIKEVALKEATRRINRLNFIGAKTDADQPLAFPRQFQTLTSYAFGFVKQDIIPEEVKMATCEEALAILKYGNNARLKAQEQNIVTVKIGDVTETYKSGSVKKLFSNEAFEFLKGYIAGSVAII